MADSFNKYMYNEEKKKNCSRTTGTCMMYATVRPLQLVRS